MVLNPFTKEIQSPESIVGRKREIGIFNSYVESTIHKKPLSMAVVGSLGMGKTILLKRFREIAEKNRCLGIYVKIQKGEGLQRVLEKSLRELESELREKSAMGWMPEEKMEMIGRKETGDSLNNLDTMRKFENSINEVYPIIQDSVNALVFLLDDGEKLEDAKDSIPIIVRIFERATRKNSPFMLVMSSKVMPRGFGEIFNVFELKPLTEEQIKELIKDRLKESKIKMGDECAKLIVRDSEGNPSVLLSICWTLFNRLGEKDKIITKAHYIKYKQSIMSSLSAEIFDPLYNGIPDSERRILIQFSKMKESPKISDVAKKMNKKLSIVTRLVLRLIRRGALIKTGRGRYKIFNRLFSEYLEKH